MSASNVTVTLIPLVPNAILPQPASPRTRAAIPPGYGVQEECLPFTAASALGFLIPSPIQFGLCRPEETPRGCRAFRSPLARPAAGEQFDDPRVFYVVDNPDCRFSGNAYEFDAADSQHTTVPGLSFFDRQDQQDLFKLHLPYVWRTPESVDTLFLPLLNRPGQAPDALCGLVETDWYSTPVNLILRKPPGPVHIRAGDPVAQVIFIPRGFRRPELEVPQWHARLSRDTLKG